MDHAPFTAVWHEGAVAQLRDLIAQVPEPEYIATARAEARKMRTSTLLGFMDNPKLLAAVMADWAGEDASDEDLQMIGVRTALVLADEIDRRMPVPGTEQHPGVVAMANELHRQALDLSRGEPDDDVKDCERRIDKLCSIAQGLSLLVRSLARSP